MPQPERPQAPTSPVQTFLPDQCRRLGDLAEVTRGALGITQDGSVLHIQAAEFNLSIDAKGNTLGTVQYMNPSQERLC